MSVRDDLLALTTGDRRWLLRMAMGAGVAMALPSVAGAAVVYDAILSADGKRRGRVPGFSTLAAALAAAPAGDKPYRILVTRGLFRERNIVTRPNILLFGEGRDDSILITNASRRDRKPGEKATSTIIVQAPGFQAFNLSISNDFDYVANMPAEAPDDPTGVTGAQATAIMLDTGSNRAYFENVRIDGYQDTLWTEEGLALFRNCRISGCTDFIYGGGRVLFERCEIVSRLRPGKPFQGFITAPSTDIDQPYGLVFDRCRLTKEAGVGPHSVALGRPWKHQQKFPDGQYSNPRAIGQSVFIRCWMDDHILADAWYHMHYTPKGGGRLYMQPEEARFFEYGSSGPGAGVPSRRRRSLTDAQARFFTPDRVLGGWHPGA
ncbi:pectinesterase family protein [Sphingomonas crusticola]|uniref:pectinesterase family protein n=1 Tax=Sphingomonas crusticola TaxID=1697973 RepID=UPI000E23D961|nr:pectinesterase family protein [Sphingomonas crusticola]